MSLAVCASAILALGALAGGSSAGVHAPDHEEHGLGSRFVDVRFRESAEVRGAGARLRAAGSAERRVRALLDAVGARDARPLVPGAPQEKLERIAERVERRTGADTPDLSAWYRLELPRGTDVEAALEVLESSPLVEVAEPVPGEPPPPPATPDFSELQTYLDPAPVGVGSELAFGDPRTRGAGVRVVDVEYSWTEDHEDLQLPPDAELGGDEFEEHTMWEHHGTAVFGILAARHNGFGVNGGIPGADVRAISPMERTADGTTYNVAGALGYLLANGLVEPGDVVLIEQQARGPTGDGDYVPIEWGQAVFDAIKALSDAGVVVVEPGGNGGQDLDDPAFEGRFDRSVRDSDAIMVGAGVPLTREPRDSTSRGSRVDLQGYGADIATTGGSVPDLQDGAKQVQYTRSFNGTSGASAIVVNAVAAVQGYLKATGQGPWAADELVALLRATGTPQGAPEKGQIGPLPDVAQALRTIEVDPPRAEAELAGGRVVISADDGWGSGVDRIEYRVNYRGTLGPWELYTEPFVPARAGEIIYRAVDGNGNASEPEALLIDPELLVPLPDTRIKVKPRRPVARGKRRAKVRVVLRSTRPGSTFRCRLDKRKWRACKRRSTYRLKPGRHVIRAYAIDSLGDADPMPARAKVRVRAKRRR